MKRVSFIENLHGEYCFPFQEEEAVSWQQKSKNLVKYAVYTKLTVRQKQVVVMLYKKNMKQREIAQHLGITESSVSHTKRTALKRIKEYVELARML